LGITCHCLWSASEASWVVRGIVCRLGVLGEVCVGFGGAGTGYGIGGGGACCEMRVERLRVDKFEIQPEKNQEQVSGARQLTHFFSSKEESMRVEKLEIQPEKNQEQVLGARLLTHFFSSKEERVQPEED